MRTTMQCLAVGLLATSVIAQSAQQTLPESGEITLKPKMQRSQKLLLPSEAATPVATGFHFEDGIGADFRANIDGTALLIDADGDGSLETRVEGDNGFVVLAKNGRRYGVRLTAKPEWSFHAGSAVTGKIGSTRIRIVDQNHNGRFDDIGKDAMVVGNGRAASFLSETISIDGQLRTIKVAADGTTLSFAPFAGETGKLSLHAVTEGKVMAAVLISLDGRHSVHLSKQDADVSVPTGDYVLHSGVLSLSGSRVTMQQGRSKPITVGVGAQTNLSWGGPAKAEFAFQDKGEELVFDPNRIWFYGATNEEYRDWNPVGKSPLIVVTDKATGRVVAETRFPGSC